MAYKTISMNGWNYIVDENRYGISRYAKDNLMKGEKKIDSLMVLEKCPKNRRCISIENDLSRICQNLGAYPMPDEKNSGEKLPCHYNGKTNIYNVKLLKVEECPNNKINCLGCELLQKIDPLPVEKSHAYIICSSPRNLTSKSL